MEHQNVQAALTRGWRRHTRTTAIAILPLVLATACTTGETDVVAVDEDSADVAAAADAGAATATVIDGPTVESAEFVTINGITPATTVAPASSSTSTSSSTSSSTSTSIAPAEPATIASPTTSDPADETATTTTVVDEATTTTEAPETTTTPAAPVDGLVEVVNESSGLAYSIHASTRAQYPASESQFWAVAMVDFGMPGGFTPDQRACLIREFLLSADGQQLVADDAAGNQAAWSDADGRPVLIDTAVLDWFNVQEVCAL